MNQVNARPEEQTKGQDGADVGPVFRPNVDIVSTNDELLIYADLPGAEFDGIDVQFDRGVLELSARIPRRDGARTPLREEYAVGGFRRAFRLAEEFDGSRTTAEYRNGVLCLRVPKAAEARATKVEIRAGKA